MPTAVEQALEKFFGQFFKSDLPDGESQRLGEGALKIDSDLSALTNPNAGAFLKLERDPGLRDDFAAIGDAFRTVGHDFHKAAVGADLIDRFILFGTQHQGGGGGSGAPAVSAALSATGGGGGAGLQADFIAADHKLNATSTDLRAFGKSFLKIDHSRTPEQFNLKLESLADGSVTLARDMAADSKAFQQLGNDFVALGGGDPNALIPAVYKELGGDLQKVAADFGALSTDFLKLDGALVGYQTGGSGTPAPTATAAGGGGGAGMPVGTALMNLFQDFHTLGADTGAVAHDSAVLVSDLIQPPTTAANTNHSH
ncbi:MAG: hypothetical protein JO339_40000 [Alphaproteobacteria bacterium]|nr:hypothetical protein [Alphaproteobacteria bacterium]